MSDITLDVHCEDCDQHLLCGLEGGQWDNDPPRCQPHCDPRRVRVWKLRGSERWTTGYLADYAPERRRDNIRP